MARSYQAVGPQGPSFSLTLASIPRCVTGLARWMERSGTEILHAHLWTADLIGLLAARRAGVRAVTTVWGPYHLPLDATGVTRWRRKLLSLGARSIYRWFDAVIAVSDSVAHDLASRTGIRVPSKRITVIPWGIDLDAVASEARTAVGDPAAARPVITMVANFHAIKGHATLLRAVPLLPASLRPAHVVLIGEGPLLEDTRALAKELQIDDRVTFLGARQDACAWLARSDVVAVPSWEEGLGLTMLEAMALGRPVVASAVGGPREVIADGDTGLLVPPGDPVRLAAAIDQVLSAPDVSLRMGQRAAQAVRERFDIRRTAGQVADVYRRLLGAGQCGA